MSKKIKSDNSKSLIIVVLFMIASSLLMLYSSTTKDFWGDEVMGIHAAKQESIKLVVQALLQHSPHPPLYNILLHYWISAFGESEISIRLLSIIFGTLSILVIFRLGKMMVNNNFGIVLAFVCAFSPFLLLFSSMARWYSLSLLLSALSYYYYLLIIKGNQNWDKWIFYALSSILLFYTHFVTYSIILVQNIFVIFYRRNSEFLKRWIVCQLIIVLLSVFPIIQLLLQSVVMSSERPEFVDLANSVLAYPVMLLYIFTSFSIGETILPWNFWATVSAFFIFVILIFFGVKAFYRDRDIFLLWLLYFFISFVLCGIAIDIADLPIFMISSHLIFITPLYYSVIAMGVYNIKSKKIKYFLLIGLSIIFGYSVINLINNNEFLNPNFIIPWKKIVNDITRNSQEGDIIISVNEASFDYYAQQHITKVVFLYSDLDTRSYAIYNPQQNTRIPVKFDIDTYKNLVYRTSYNNLWLITRDRGARQTVQFVHGIQNLIEKTHSLVNIFEYVKEDPITISFKQRLLGRTVPAYKVSVRQYQKAVEGELPYPFLTPER